MNDDIDMDARRFLWQLVPGVDASKARRRHIAMLQAYFDDSKDGLGKRYLVLAGYMADADTWIKFAKEWEDLLTMKPRMEVFKFSSFNLGDELSEERVRHFYRCIERHELIALCVGVPIDSYHKVCEEIGLPSFLRNPYFLAFVGAYKAVSDYAASKGYECGCELVFDRQDGESSLLLQGWLTLQKMGVKFMGGPMRQPKFLDDHEVVPLQAADLCAGLFRKQWENAGTILEPRVPAPWVPKGRHRGFILEHDEASLREALGNVLRQYTDDMGGSSQLTAANRSPITYSIEGEELGSTALGPEK